MTPTLDEQIRSATAAVCRRLDRQAREQFFSGNSLVPPDQSVNHEVIAAACALLAAVDDVQGFVLDPDHLREFDLRAVYGIDPRPLFHLNAFDRQLTQTVRRLFARDDDPVERCFLAVLADLRQILERKLLGGQTAGKMAFVRDIVHVPLSRLTGGDLEDQFATIRRLPEPLRVHESRDKARQLIELRGATLDLLARQRARLVGHPKDAAVERMQQQLRASMSIADVLFLNLQQLSRDDPRAAFGFDDFCASYCDEIVHIIAGHADEPSAPALSETWRCVRGRGIEVAYAPRDADFLQLGDLFGDCTARRTNKQVDQQIANIHWTVYAWLLDPFYRVLLVHVDGEPALKAHLTPLIVHDEPILAIDALEVVPSLRDIVNGRPHRFLSERLFSQRAEILQAALDTARDVADRMGVARILVDKYSNAAWVRQAIDLLPEEAYRIAAVEKPFGSRPVAALVQRWLGNSPRRVNFEIQHFDPALMDQGLYPGNKLAAVLRGTPRGRGIRLRGP